MRIPAYYVVMNAFLSIIAMLASFFPIGIVFGNKKLLILHQLRQSPWIAKNYWEFTLINLLFLSYLPLNFMVYFLNLSNLGVK